MKRKYLVYSKIWLLSAALCLVIGILDFNSVYILLASLCGLLSFFWKNEIEKGKHEKK